MADTIGKFTNRLEDKPGDFRRKLLSASLAPAGTEREALEARRAELQRSLRPTPDDTARAVITLLLASGKSYGMTERESDAREMLYGEALRQEPTWAIEKARQRFAKGGWQCNWDGRDVPPTASVVAECRFITLEVETEIGRINAILDAELVDTDTTENERREAVARWEQIKAQMGRSNVITERTGEEIDRERAEQVRANAAVELRDAMARKAAGLPPAPSPFAPRRAYAEAEGGA
ncbi:hypothetical protein [Methylobacterium sp. Leaf118]|uniref:hypothetical protein n=1 Tax=Methylobacterium sp. Leaf118 TaxID=2876562 RepID=UPI001E4A2F37|nr:hypothetical protein [Methylobacterium sp. Leaf118]